MRVSAEISNRFANIGLLCALCVVVLHVSLPLPYEAIRSISYDVLWAAVPAYFMMSGYLLAVHNESGWWKSALRKRVRTLGIPFLLWNFVAFLQYRVMPLLGANVKNGESLFSGISGLFTVKAVARVLGVDFCTQPQLSALWYVRALFFLVLLSPFLKLILRKFGWWSLGLFYVLEICYVWHGYGHRTWFGIFDSILPLRGFCWFMLGMSFAMGLKRFPSRNVVLGSLSLIVSFALAVVGYACRDFIAGFPVMTLCIPFSLASIVFLVPEIGLPRKLISCTMHVYLLHMFILTYLSMLIFALAPNLFTIAARSQCLVGLVFCGYSIVAFLCSLLVALLIKVLFPKGASILFGGR